MIEGRWHPARADDQPPNRSRSHGRPGVLAPRHQPVADGDLARPDARPAIDLAFAPAALAGAAHQPARPVEAEAAGQDRSVGSQQRDRERLALERLERLAVECDADPAPCGGSAPGPHGKAGDAPPCQRMWKVGQLSMQTRLDSRYSSRPSMPSSRPMPLLLDAAERALGQADVVGVHPDVADPQPARETDRAVEVGRPDRAAEPERVVVGERERLGLIVERDAPTGPARRSPRARSTSSAWTSSKIVGAM